MILIDNNLPPGIANDKELKENFWRISHVTNFDLDEESDYTIWAYATTNHYHILTKDNDFKDIQQLRGYPPKIIFLRCGNAKTSHIIQLIKRRIPDILEFLENPDLGILEIF